MSRAEILKKANFEEINGVKVLRIKGKPYEMGYQHGYLLADKIALMINRTLLATTLMLLHKPVQIWKKRKNCSG